MTIVVAGASGNMGGRIAKALTARGAEVVAVSHTATNLEEACAGARCVVSAVQGLRDAIVDFQTRLACCGVAWEEMPDGRLDSIQKLETVAPSGVRLPSRAELEAARPALAVIREEALESWRADIPGLTVG